MISGGQNQTDFFRVQKNTAGTDYEILADITGTTVALLNSDKAFMLNELADTKINFQEDGTVQVSFDNYQDDDDIYAFLDAVNPPEESAAVDLPDVLLENGVKRTSSSTGNLVLGITYGALSADGTKIKTAVYLGTIKRTSGSYGQKADDWSKPTFEFEGVKAEFDLDIIAALYDSTILDATDVGTKLPKIATNAGFARKFVTKAA